MNSKDSISIRPAGNILGSLRVPGDKSISHRYAMLAALAQGRSRFDNFAPGADCASTLGCVRELGCEVSSDDKGVVTIDGLGAQLEAPSKQLDCGNSGSTMRMLSGILAAQPFSSELIGDESLSRRPMKRIIEPLTQMGAKISAANGDRAPLRIDGGRLRGIEYRPAVASAQVKTSVLFAGLLAEGRTAVYEPARTRDHGELALRAFGAEVERTQHSVSIQGGQTLKPLETFRSRRYFFGGVLSVCGFDFSGVESGHRRCAVESNSLCIAGRFDRDGKPHLDVASRGKLRRAGWHDIARSRSGTAGDDRRSIDGAIDR